MAITLGNLVAQCGRGVCLRICGDGDAVVGKRCAWCDREEPEYIVYGMPCCEACYLQLMHDQDEIHNDQRWR